MSVAHRVIRRSRASKLNSRHLTSCNPLLFLFSRWLGSLSTDSPTKALDLGDRTANSHDGAKLSSPSREKDHVYTRKPFTSIKTPRFSHPTLSPDAEEKEINVLAEKIASNIKSSGKSSQHCIGARLKHHYLSEPSTWKPDWRDIRAILVRTTPVHGPRLERACQISIPIASAQRFLCGVDDFILDIGEMHGCTIELLSAEISHDYTNFVLTGSLIAIKRTIASIRDLEPGVQVKHIEVPQTPARCVVSEHKRSNLPAHTVPRPNTWTPMSILQYVEDLTAHDTSSHLLRFLRASSTEPTPSNYCVVVMRLIRELITDPSTQSIFPRAAFHRAMGYFVRKNRIDYVRELFINLLGLGFQCTPRTYNIMLNASATNEDLANFHFILHMMLRDGLTPNGKTWAAFMMALPFREVRLHLYEQMKKKGLLSQTKTLQLTVEQLISYDVETSLCKQQKLATFIETMNNKYGSKWLSIEAANRVLAVFGKYCLTYKTFQFLDFMEEHFQYPDTYSVNTLLHSCALKPDPWVATWKLLQVGKFQALLQPDGETCRLLFGLAWRTRSYNLAKLTWRYACLSATTSVSPRKQIIRNLRNGMPLHPESMDYKWRDSAGLVILGSMMEPHPMRVCANPSAPLSDALKSPTPLAPSTKPPLAEEFSSRIDLDLQVFKNWRPSTPFGPTLFRAMERDVEWRNDRVFETKSLAWLIENSESIRIFEKFGNHACITWN